MPKVIDITGQRFGRLVAVQKTMPRRLRTFWRFRCDCGVEKEIDSNHVRHGRIQSCGCYLAEVLRSEEHRQHCQAMAKLPRTHGMSRTPVHAVWKTMWERCRNPKCHDYRWYGALGVKVCDRWASFENFYADMGEPNGLTLDRIDPRGNYEPKNCRWTSWDVQRANKRSNANRPYPA
jgi:hypothetical protein